jgi:uncharacterized protein Yka (UPF0111/DUF47 family)
VLSNSIKTISPAAQHITEAIEGLSLMNEKYPDKSVQLIEKYIEEVRKIEEEMKSIELCVGAVVE